MENKSINPGGAPTAAHQPTTPREASKALGDGGRRRKDGAGIDGDTISGSVDGSSSDQMFRDLFTLMRATIQPRVPVDLLLDASSIPLLSGQRSAVGSKNAPPDPEREASLIREHLEESLTSQAAAASVECTKRRLDRLRRQRKRFFRTERAANDRRALLIEAMHTEAQLASISASVHASAAMKGLVDIEAGSTRKLQELAFDIIGEYGKSFIRAKRRCDNVSISDCKRLAFLVTQMRWTRFISKLVSDVLSRLQTSSRSSDAGFKGTLLNRAENGSEAKQVIACIRKKLPGLSFDDAQVASIVKFERSKRRDRNSEGTNLYEPLIVENASDFRRVEDQLLSWQQPMASRALSPKSPTSKTNLESNAPASDPAPKCYLHDFIDASSIEWLSPPAHAPHIWDDIVSEEVKTSKSPIQTSGVEVNDEELRDTVRDELDIGSVAYHQQFGRCFSLQHVTGLHVNRLYYCIEERKLWSQASQSQSKIRDFVNNTSESAMTLMNKLEAIYVPDKIKIDVEALRNDLDGVLDICGSKATHRDVAHEDLAKMNDDDKNIRISVDCQGDVLVKELSSTPSPELLLSMFPEIVQVRASSGRIFHFASAMLVNLIETSYFCANCRTPQEIEFMTKSMGFSHPILTTTRGLSSNGIDYCSTDASIARLYCIAQPPLMPRSLRPMQLNGSSAVERFQVPLRHQTLQTTIESTKPSLFMLPLADVCHEELIRVHFGIDIHHKDSLRPLINASRILPDHSRLMCSLTYHAPQRVYNVDSSYEKPEKFSHVYVLIECCSSPSASDGSTSPFAIKRTTTQPSMNNKLTKLNLDSDSNFISKVDSNYFFVQLRRHELMNIPIDAAESSMSSKIRLSSELRRRNRRWQVDEMMLSRILIEGSMDSVAVSYANASREALITSARSDTRVSSSDVDKRKWDPQLLSSLCRWKACMCEASGRTESRHYCEYHAELKRFLDSCAANGAEGVVFDTSKYVPRKPPLIPSNEADRDVRLIRWASHMLQEIHDGKLKASLQSFVKKVCNEVPLRARLDAATNQYKMRINNAKFCFRDGGVQLGHFLTSSTHPKLLQTGIAARKGDSSPALTHNSIKMDGYLPTHRIPPSPAWAKWRDKASEDARSIDEELALLKEIEDILRQISRFERRCSAEVQTLGQHAQYAPHNATFAVNSKRSVPQESAATAEMEENEHQVAISVESLSLLREELELVERKASLLKERRVEAEREAAAVSAARQDAKQQALMGSQQRYYEGEDTALDSERSRGPRMNPDPTAFADAGYYALSARAPSTPKGRRDGEGGEGKKRPSVLNTANSSVNKSSSINSNSASGKRTPNRTGAGTRYDMQF